MELTIQVKISRVTEEHRLPATATIRHLKQKIIQQANNAFPESALTLMFSGRRLENLEQTLESYRIRDNCVVQSVGGEFV